MNNTFNGWNLSETSKFEEVVDLVITDGTYDTIHADTHLFEYIPPHSSAILDFGAGVGRNTYELVEKFNSTTVYGYDNPDMLNYFIEYGSVKYNKLPYELPRLVINSDWEFFKPIKFDCILATLVFQHIYEDALTIYLNDIKTMTKRLIVSGRRFNDDIVDCQYKNTWQIMEKRGYYPTLCSAEYKTYGNPHEHFTCIYDL